MRGLITNRTQSDVVRRTSLSKKGWANMTEAERKEWRGDPMLETGVNLFPHGPHYSSTVGIKYFNDHMVATALVDGIYLFTSSIIGEAEKYENKTFTLSVGKVESSNGGIPALALYWHDETGFDPVVGAVLWGAGSITFNTADSPNTNKRKQLALYVYVTQEEPVVTGAKVTFTNVMLENGGVRHEFVPYTEILATPTTRGAYNYSDLNRVERAVMEISELAGLNLTTKTDWAMWDIPTKSDMTRYLNNIMTIRAYCGSTEALPTSMDNLTFTYANNIEKILLAAYTLVSAGVGGSV